MDKIKKYKKQIFTFITIFLLLEFGIFPCLTAADTFSNIIGAIALGILILWGGLELYDFVKSSTQLSDEEYKAFQSELENDIREMEANKPKTKRKPKSVVKIDVTNAKGMNEVAGIVNPIAEGRVKISVENSKPKTEKVLGEFQINNKEKVRKSTIKKTK